MIILFDTLQKLDAKMRNHLHIYIWIWKQQTDGKFHLLHKHSLISLNSMFLTFVQSAQNVFAECKEPSNNLYMPTCGRM